MLKTNCPPKIKRPQIKQQPFEATEEETDLAKKLAAEISRIVVIASGDDIYIRDTCSLAALARKRLSTMSRKGRLVATRSAKKLASARSSDKDHEQNQDRAGDADIDPKLRALARQYGRRRLDALRPEMKSAIKMVVAQADEFKLAFPKTTVKMRLPGEFGIAPFSYTCSDGPVELIFNWQSSEPEVARVYWELRGPIVNGYPGKFLARGYGENINGEGPAGGYFTINLSQYLSPLSPDPTERYYVRVLPLADPGKQAMVSYYSDHSLSTIGQNFDPEPPLGVGPWSIPAVIDIGLECRTPPTYFDIDTIEFYRKARVKVNWFKVDANQTGPGDEEYHLRAFMVEHTPLGSTSIGTFGSYLPVTEGDKSEHPLGWKSYIRDLGEPVTNMWPRLFMVGISVLEEDHGDELDEWSEAIAELAREAVEGDLADELSDFLRDMQDEIDEATTAFRAELASEMASYIGALIGASALGAIAAVVAFAAGLIGIFANAGARDDVYGVGVVTLALVTNDAALIKDGTAGSIQSSRVLASGGSFSGTEQDGRFELDEIEIQLIDKGGPDEAGLGGIVRMGLSWEFYDKVTRYY